MGWNNLNIVNMTNKSRGDVAYTMMDLENTANESILNQLRTIDGVFRVRVVKYGTVRPENGIHTQYDTARAAFFSLRGEQDAAFFVQIQE